MSSKAETNRETCQELKLNVLELNQTVDRLNSDLAKLASNGSGSRQTRGTDAATGEEDKV